MKRQRATSSCSGRRRCAGLQLVVEGQIPPQEDAAGLIHVIGPRFEAPTKIRRLREDQILGLAVSHGSALEDAIEFALDQDLDVLLVNGNTATGRDWPELTGAPDLTLMRDTIACLRRLNMEEEIDILWFGACVPEGCRPSSHGCESRWSSAWCGPAPGRG